MGASFEGGCERREAVNGSSASVSSASGSSVAGIVADTVADAVADTATKTAKETAAPAGLNMPDGCEAEMKAPEDCEVIASGELPRHIEPLRLDAALAYVLPALGVRARRRMWEWCRVIVNGSAKPPGYTVHPGDYVRIERKNAVPTAPATAASCSTAPATTASCSTSPLTVSPCGAAPIGPTPSGAVPIGAAPTGATPTGATPALSVPYVPEPTVTAPCAPAGNNVALSVVSTLEVGDARLAVSAECASLNEPEFFGPVRLVSIAGEYAAFSKPEGVHSAVVAGAASAATVESLVNAGWGEWLAHRPSGALLEADANAASAAASALTTVSSAPASVPASAPASASACVPASAPACAASASRQRIPTGPPLLVTRLDFPTSGILLAAFGGGAVSRFREYEREGRVIKCYAAIVRGRLERELFLTRRLLVENRARTGIAPEDDADPARHTFVRPLRFFPAREALPEATLVLARIMRGARHQIRAHLADAGFPLFGESLYAQALSNVSGTRLYLHHAKTIFPGFCVSVLPDWPEWDTALFAEALNGPGSS